MATRVYQLGFAFETPRQRSNNDRCGWEDANTWQGIWITANSRDEALAWGSRIAEEFIRRLYEQAGSPPPSEDRGFWSERITGIARPGQVTSMGFQPVVMVGEMPDFATALAHWRE